MPSIQKRPVSVAEEIAELKARATKLESYQPSGMTLLGSIQNTTGGTGTGNGAWQTLAASTVSFTLLRPVPIFALALINCAALTGSSPETSVLVNGVQHPEWAPVAYNMQGGGVLVFASCTPFAVIPALDAGAYSFALGITQASGGPTWIADTYYLYVFQLAG